MLPLSPLSLGLACLLFVTGCTTMSRSDKERYRELQAMGLGSGNREIKSPATAGALNLLPGIGNFYLAVGTEESEQWLFGALNLLTWPISPIWAIPEGVLDAGTINKKEVVYYYTYDPNGQRELRLMKKHLAPAPAKRFGA